MKAPSIGFIPQRARDVLAPVPASAGVIYQGYEMTQGIEPVRSSALGGLVIGLAVYALVRRAEAIGRSDFTPKGPEERGRAVLTLAAFVMGGVLGALEGIVLHGNIAGSITSGASGALYAFRSSAAIGLAPDLGAPQPETTPDWWKDRPNVLQPRGIPPRDPSPLPLPARVQREPDSNEVGDWI